MNADDVAACRVVQKPGGGVCEGGAYAGWEACSVCGHRWGPDGCCRYCSWDNLERLLASPERASSSRKKCTHAWSQAERPGVDETVCVYCGISYDGDTP